MTFGRGVIETFDFSTRDLFSGAVATAFGRFGFCEMVDFAARRLPVGFAVGFASASLVCFVAFRFDAIAFFRGQRTFILAQAECNCAGACE